MEDLFKICLNTSPTFGYTVPEQIRLFHKVGFDGFFTEWKRGELAGYAETARGEKMIFQSVHAPYHHVAAMWKDDADAGEAALAELLDCARETAGAGVPLMISHVYIGDFNKVGVPTEIGLSRFGRLVREAERLGLRIAFENTEGEEYLDAVMGRFADSPAVGFCYDSGHALCYNAGSDLLGKFGARLFGTHLEDNLGVRDPEGQGITCHDDLHLLPFDGIADWEKIAGAFASSGYAGELTFELKRAAEPDTAQGKRYLAMSVEEYLAEAYRRARRFAALLANRRALQKG